MVATMSAGPGATNTVTGMATALADSASLLLITGSPRTHLQPHGTMQEVAVCVTNNIPVTFGVQNNSGFMSIRGGQRKLMDRHIASEFTRQDGSPYSPAFVAFAKSFGVHRG
jgi:thiamine pyrophosphate-dependent acetolactate synthase large subunit-like protein